MIRLAVIFAVVFAARIAAVAQDQQRGERVYEIAETTKPPRLTHQVNPDYSKAKGVRVKGSIEVGAVISAAGVPTSVQVLQGLAPEIDRCAVDAVKQWRFSAAEKDGKPVAVKVSIELEFHPM